MTLILRDQPHAQLLALGVSRVVASPVRVEPGASGLTIGEWT